jgi:hypothetical protein
MSDNAKFEFLSASITICNFQSICCTFLNSLSRVLSSVTCDKKLSLIFIFSTSHLYSVNITKSTESSHNSLNVFNFIQFGVYSEFFNDANRVIIEDIEVLFLDNLFKSIKYLTFQLVYSKFVDKLYAQGIFSISG